MPSFIDVVDVFLVAFIIYQIYNLIRGTIAANILIGLLILYALGFVVEKLSYAIAIAHYWLFYQWRDCNS